VILFCQDRQEIAELEGTLAWPLERAMLDFGRNEYERYARREAGERPPRAWPSLADIYATARRAFQTHAPEACEGPDAQSAFDGWLLQYHQHVWDLLTEQVPPEERERLTLEYAIHLFSQERRNAIHIEEFYRSLPALGGRAFQKAPPAVRERVSDAAVQQMVEINAIGTPLPEWVRGAILYLTQLHSAGPHRDGSAEARPAAVDERRELNATQLQENARWVCGPHLRGLDLLTLIERFEQSAERRRQAHAEVAHQNPYDQDPPVSAPLIRDGDNQLHDWLLCWGFIPVADPKTREQSKTAIAFAWFRQRALHCLKESLAVRWLRAIAQREYLRRLALNADYEQKKEEHEFTFAPAKANAASACPPSAEALLALATTHLAWEGHHWAYHRCCALAG
jgi:hypothetical protein